MKPIVYKNFGTNIYLQFQEDEEWDYFVRLHTGTVETCKLRKNETAQLQLLGTDQIHSPQHCAEIFLNSTLPKSNERVTRILTVIKEGKDLPKFTGLESSNAGNLEANKLTKQQKMDLVGKGAEEIAKKNRKAPTPDFTSNSSSPAAPRKPSGATNQIDLADICVKLGVDPGDARKAIRGANWTKPGGRWAWDKDQAAQIEADLAKLMGVGSGS